MMGASGAGRRPVALAVVATAVAPFLAYTVVRTTAYEATSLRTNFGSALPPASLWPDIRRTMRTARVPRSPVPPNMIDLARRAAVAYPLAFEPYFLAARVAERQGRYPQATALMEEARRRRPNYAPTRVQLLDYYSLANAYQQAIDEADFAMRANLRTATYILPAFAKLIAADPKARRAIAVALARGPIWEPAFLDEAASSGMKPDDAFALMEDIRRASGNRGDRRAQDQFLVRLLVNSKQYGRARQHWAATLARAGEAGDLIVDPTFARGSEPPFGWQFSASGEGVAERARGSASEPPSVSISFFGSAPATLAQQTTVLAPGRYRLTTRYRVDGPSEDGGLFWRVACIDAASPLGELRLLPGEQTRTGSTDFTVPASCGAQTISLAGVSGDLPRTMTGQVYAVEVRPVAAGGNR